MNKQELIQQHLLKYVNIPYIWGGNNPLTGLDCSGMALDFHRSWSNDYVHDMTAQFLFDRLRRGDHFIGGNSKRCPGTYIFYGRGLNDVVHVDIMLSEYYVVGMIGGGSWATSVEAAKERGACGKIRPLGYRSDYITSITPKFVL